MQQLAPIDEDWNLDDSPILLSEVFDQTALVEVQKLDEMAQFGHLVVEAADALKADKEAKAKARETGKIAKRKLEMLREVLKDHATKEEIKLPPVVLEPFDEKRLIPYIKEAQSFFQDRYKARPDQGERLLALWKHGVKRFPSWVREHRVASRDQRPIDFILGDWRREMMNGAWEITEWR